MTDRKDFISREKFMAELYRYKKGSFTRRHFLGVTGLGTATAVLGGVFCRVDLRSAAPVVLPSLRREIMHEGQQLVCRVTVRWQAYARIKAGEFTRPAKLVGAQRVTQRIEGAVRAFGQVAKRNQAAHPVKRRGPNILAVKESQEIGPGRRLLGQARWAAGRREAQTLFALAKNFKIRMQLRLYESSSKALIERGGQEIVDMALGKGVLAQRQVSPRPGHDDSLQVMPPESNRT